MGHPQLDKLQTHERILDIASKRFRERGIDGISISEIMKEVGITVGGFYRHFSSREALVSEAVSVAFDNTSEWNELANRQLGKAVDEFLSSAQYDDLASCTIFSCLAADIRRSNPATRGIFNRHLEQTLAAIAGGLVDTNVDRRGDKAVAILAALVGASLLARGTSDPRLSQKMLKTVANEIHFSYICDPPLSS
jgi:TetR/AcrR family transcriptional repressor of nem operon